MNLSAKYEKAKRDRKFQRRLDELLKTYAGRPTPLFFAQTLPKSLAAENLSQARRLLHTGAHKIKQLHWPGVASRAYGQNSA